MPYKADQGESDDNFLHWPDASVSSIFITEHSISYFLLFLFDIPRTFTHFYNIIINTSCKVKTRLFRDRLKSIGCLRKSSEQLMVCRWWVWRFVDFNLKGHVHLGYRSLFYFSTLIWNVIFWEIFECIQ